MGRNTPSPPPPLPPPPLLHPPPFQTGEGRIEAVSRKGRFDEKLFSTCQFRLALVSQRFLAENIDNVNMQFMDPQSKLAEVNVDFAEIVEEGSVGW